MEVKLDDQQVTQHRHVVVDDVIVQILGKVKTLLKPFTFTFFDFSNWN